MITEKLYIKILAVKNDCRDLFHTQEQCRLEIMLATTVVHVLMTGGIQLLLEESEMCSH